MSSALAVPAQAIVLQHDSRHLPFADNTIDLVVTSPPYFALRSYQDAGEHYAGQVGAEATPAEFIDSLIEVTAECVRVLKPTGSLWVNLGDKYQATSYSPAKRGKDTPGVERPTVTRTCERCGVEFTGGPGRRFCSAFCGGSDNSKRANRGGIQTKSLMGIPWRYALRCIDDLGLILRAEVIWAKPNGLPESVTDRVRRSHETWFHFTLEPRYFSAVDEIREEHSGPWKSPGGGNPAAAVGPQDRNGHSQWDRTREERDATVRNPLGKLPGSVWSIATEPLKVPKELGVDHFAAFPTEWPRRIINGWSPAGICVECGDGRRPVATKSLEADNQGRVGHHGGPRNDAPLAGPARAMLNGHAVRSITSYACACETPDAATRPAVVLDPFGGTGTTAMVAKALGRHGISVDMSADYCRLAEWRTNDPVQLERVQNMQTYGIRKPTKKQIREHEETTEGVGS